MALFTEVPVPSVGDTSWYDWAEALDRTIRANGAVQLDSYGNPGDSDDTKLTLAMTHMAGATVTRRAQIALSNRDYTFSTVGRIPYDGFKLIGAGSNVGFQNTEQNAKNAPTRVTLNVGFGANSWLKSPSTTAQVFSVSISDIAFNGDFVDAQFIDWPFGTSSSLYAASFGNLNFAGFKHVFGRPAEAMACTLNTWHGAMNITGMQDEPITLRGSDNWFTPDAFNINWGSGPTGKYLIRCNDLVKSFFKNLYLTCFAGTTRGIIVEGAYLQGGLHFSDCVIEGENKDGGAAAGALIVCTNNYSSWHNINLNYYMANPTPFTPDDTAGIMVSGGEHTFHTIHTQKAQVNTGDVPFMTVSGGIARVRWVIPCGTTGNTWSTGRPRALATGGTLDADTTVRTV